jgi:hypothetical protein
MQTAANYQDLTKTLPERVHFVANSTTQPRRFLPFILRWVCLLKIFSIAKPTTHTSPTITGLYLTTHGLSVTLRSTQTLHHPLNLTLLPSRYKY